MLIEFFKWLFGYVNFTASGGMTDRFLNLCTAKGISLWNIKNIGGNITASTTIAGYLSIRSVCKKSGMRTICIEKKGFPFFIRKNKKRVGILIGIVLFAVVFFVLSQFVWSVSVVGNTNLDEDFLLQKFEGYGIKVGTRVSSLELEEATKKALNEIETLSWATINKRGNIVVIEVREKKEAPIMYDDSVPTNVIASEDGVILSIEVLEGRKAVKVGSAVTKGDLLIGGVVSYKDGTEILTHADGFVKALVKKKQTFLPNEFELYSQSNAHSRKLLYFFGIKIPFGKPLNQTEKTEHKSFIQNDKMFLPLGIITEYGADFDDKIVANGSLQEKLSLFSMSLYVKELYTESVIVNSTITVQETDDGKQFDFYAECEQEIGKIQEIYVEKNNDTE